VVVRRSTSGGPSALKIPLISRKKFSKPAGVMISMVRAWFGPGFQKVCAMPRGLMTQEPASAVNSSSPISTPMRPSMT
jgi:hypothetical protein